MRYQSSTFSPPLNTALLPLLIDFIFRQASPSGRRGGYWQSQASTFHVHNLIVLSVSIFPFSDLILISSVNHWGWGKAHSTDPGTVSTSPRGEPKPRCTGEVSWGERSLLTRCKRRKWSCSHEGSDFPPRQPGLVFFWPIGRCCGLCLHFLLSLWYYLIASAA